VSCSSVIIVVLSLAELALLKLAVLVQHRHPVTGVARGVLGALAVLTLKAANIVTGALAVLTLKAANIVKTPRDQV
jgi:hypothetical protein